MASLNTHQHSLENSTLIWFDPNVDDYQNELQHLTKQLQRFVDSIKTFIHADQCVDYLSDIKNAKAFLIVPHILAQQFVPLIYNIPQLNSIYVVSDDQTIQEQWIKEYDKVKIVFDKNQSLCNALKNDIYRTDLKSTSIGVVSVSSVLDLNQLDPSFMYSQLLKEILLNMNYGEKANEEFIELCLIKEVENESAHRIIDEFEQNYDSSSPIWWYTRPCFIFSMVNQALREQNIDIILKMGFFIRDLHRQIERLHSDPDNAKPPQVYRGQGMFNAAFQNLRKNVGGLLSFNSFLSTSTDEELAFARADSCRQDRQLTGIIFQIELDPSISTTPFASLDKHSHFLDSEKEILFSMHTVFRISDMKRIDDRLWKVELVLTRDTDEDLNRLTNYMRKEIREQTTPAQLAHLMLKMGEFNKAEETYKTILESATGRVSNNRAGLHNNIGHVMTQKNDLDNALSHLKEALAIRQTILPSDHLDMAASYNNIGDLYHSKGEFPAALFHHEKALEIWQKCLPPNHLNLATSHNNIGEVHRSMGNGSAALSHHDMALKIRQKSLPSTHADLAMSHNNIGLAYQLTGQLTNALTHLKKALEIMQKSVPSSHFSLATTHNNIGETYLSMRNFPAALLHHEKAMEIQKSLPPIHPDQATTHNHMGMVYHVMGEYSTALPHYKTAIEMFQKSLPSNHPDLARSHSNIGLLYQSMGDYSSASSHCQKSLEMLQASLPADHLEIQTLSLIIATIPRENNRNRCEHSVKILMDTRSVESCTSKLDHDQMQLPEDELD